MTIRCPNCESTMGAGDPCPECDHNDGDPDGCECGYCETMRDTDSAYEERGLE